MSAPEQRTIPVRVLLVDDDQGFTDVLRRRLVRRGLTVRTAGDGGEAFSMIEAEPFDVVVLDVGLPDVDGMQLLRAIKRCSRSIEVIVLTGGNTGTLESFRAGAFDLFNKPAGADVLADRIIEAARSRIGRTPETG
jgi:DNA-binding response OmpR family regulator